MKCDEGLMVGGPEAIRRLYEFSQVQVTLRLSQGLRRLLPIKARRIFIGDDRRVL